MNVDELKAEVDSYRTALKEKGGSMVRFTESGPVGMSVIDAMVSTIEELDKRIAELEAKAAK